MQIGVFTGFKLQRSRFTRLLDVTPKIWILVSNSSGVDLHARAYKARYIFLWFQTPAEQIYTYLKIMCNFCRKTFQTPAEQIYTLLLDFQSSRLYGFKLQRSRFTPILTLLRPRSNIVSNSSGVDLHKNGLIKANKKINVSNSSGVDLHKNGLIKANKKINVSNSSGVDLHQNIQCRGKSACRFQTPAEQIYTHMDRIKGNPNAGFKSSGVDLHTAQIRTGPNTASVSNSSGVDLH